jgi:hypothetical protein
MASSAECKNKTTVTRKENKTEISKTSPKQ